MLKALYIILYVYIKEMYSMSIST